MYQKVLCSWTVQSSLAGQPRWSSVAMSVRSPAPLSSSPHLQEETWVKVKQTEETIEAYGSSSSSVSPEVSSNTGQDVCRQLARACVYACVDIRIVVM